MWREHWNQLWRLFFIQSSRNERTLDGLGFFAVIAPRLKRWAGTRPELAALAERHLASFNANPALASYVAGVVVNLESRRKLGEDVSAERIDRMKGALSAALTARGDYFFETILAPLGLTIAVTCAIYNSYIGLAAFLALYGFYHFQSRIGGYLKGASAGESVGGELVRGLFREQGILGGAAAFAAGVFTAIVFTRANAADGVRGIGWGAALMAGVLLSRRRLSFTASVAACFLAALLIAAFG
jgi:mannose/fructose/N-acetylgalactosamine-specific phosphotransferase system component IID